MNTTNQETFDFSQVESPVSVAYLRPGYHVLHIAGAEYNAPQGTNKNGEALSPYVEVVFNGKKGQIGSQYMITPKAMPRLQYLFQALTGSKLDKKFESAEQVGKYFEALLNKDQIKVKELHIIVGGRRGKNNAVYANIPYSDYIVPTEVPFEEKEFIEGSDDYNRFVQAPVHNASSSNDALILPNIQDSNDPLSDLPF
jgi:hypothetical protein